MRVRYFKFAGRQIYKVWWNFFAVVCDVFGRVDVVGYENIPQTPCIIVGNHVSYLDPTAMGFFHEKMMCAVARDTLMNKPLTGALFRRLNAVPVKRGQSGNLGAFREVLKRIKDGNSVIIFPEGTRSPDGKLLPGKPGAGLLAIKAGAPILPVRSFNFERVLPRSNILRGGERIVICIGKPVMPSEIDPGKDHSDRAEIIVNSLMERIAAIECPRVFEV